MARAPTKTDDGSDSPFVELGATGLRQYGGYVREEWLKDLQGWRGIRMLREMRDNDPVIGAIFFAIEMLLRGVAFTVEPVGTTSDDVEAAEFVNACLTDMEQSWPELIAEVLSFLQYGWAVHETVYKLRSGKTGDPKSNSKYDDGLIGWRKFAGRAQETLLRWDFDESGDATAMIQLLPTGGSLHTVPLEKCLHFRTVPLKNNPEGRALDPETIIPTPDGWRRLDDLDAGDKVFDEGGHVRYITARADWMDRPCYRLTFGDGTEIIADAAHQWLTHKLHERASRKPARIRTTAQIAARTKNTNGVTEHSIAWAGALDYPRQALPLDPYVLGMWLGDGHSRAAMITCHADDLEETCALIESAGYPTEIKHNGAANGAGRLIRFYGGEKWASDGPSAALRVLGVMGNKHIPEAYLRGSTEQRQALLSGLMDSDGHVDDAGRCEFTNTNHNLAAGAAELVRSLGIGARMTSYRTDHDTPAWKVKFTPTWAPFRLGRKAARCKTERQRTAHYIVAAEPVEPRRTVCIEVDSPSHLFLAGESMVPTHNSILRNAYVPYYFKKRIQEIEAIGIERDMCGIAVASVPARLLNRDASASDKAQLEAIKKIVRDTARNEQEGIVWPLVYDDNHNELYKLTLLSTGGRRQFDTSGVIERYDHRITATVLADFIVLGGAGSAGRGSFAQSKNKTDIFAIAVVNYLDMITAEFNRKAIPELLELNGMAGEVKMQHADISRRDLDELGNYILHIAQAGALTPDAGIEAHLREEGGLPAQIGNSSDQLNQGGTADEASEEDAAETISNNPRMAQGQGGNGRASA